MRIDKAPTALGGAMVLALKYRYAAIAPTGRGENVRRSKATRVA
jgi:hypothetical protein